MPQRINVDMTKILTEATGAGARTAEHVEKRAKKQTEELKNQNKISEAGESVIRKSNQHQVGRVELTKEQQRVQRTLSDASPTVQHVAQNILKT